MRIGYIFALFFIVGWWALAFAPKQTAAVPVRCQKTLDVACGGIYSPALSLLHRDNILRALSGDFALISRLLLDWDSDAQLLQVRGIEGIARLPQERLLAALDLAYRLGQQDDGQLAALRKVHRKPSVTDSTSTLFPCIGQNPKIIPHTLAAASFVLALNGTENVVALPKGIRTWQPYFPDTPLDAVAYDCDRALGEAISAAKPDIAFVAPYSNPSSLTALKSQGTAIFTLSELKSQEDIVAAIEQVGEAINRSLEAQVLATFIDAAFLCIDNRVALLKTECAPLKKPLVAYYYGQWYFPTYKTLTARLAERAGIPYALSGLFDHEHSVMWLQPLTNEQIVSFNPSHLIVAADKASSAFVHTLMHKTALPDVDAFTLQNIQTIDAEVQQSVSQHIVLAYFDLYYSLIHLAEPCPKKSGLLTSAWLH